MDELLLTRPSLLVRIRDPHDRTAWRQFVDLYGTLVYRFARNRGLQDADAADLTQEVFQAVAKAAGRLEYDPRQGTFRGWLYTIARHKLADFLARRQRQPIGSGNTTALRRLDEEPSPDGDDDEWEHEFRRQRFLWAAGQVKGHFTPSTWQAFWQTAVDGRPVAEVAAELGLSAGAVYVARSRVLARFAEQVRQLPDD
jgi:RNA polymerase sigma-70 factor (ECF subfamily)